MAFTTASGYGNLPNGNFSPIIYSKQVQLAFRKAAVAEAITNNDYFGDIAQMGDSVKIIKEPEITVKAYERDVLGYMSGFKQSAIHGVADTANTTVNGSKAVSTAGSNELLAEMQVDANDFGGSAYNGIGIQPRLPGASAVPGSGNANPTMIIARMARKLDQQNVDTQGRWLVVNPVFLEILKDEDSKLLKRY